MGKCDGEKVESNKNYADNKKKNKLKVREQENFIRNYNIEVLEEHFSESCFT